VNKRYVGYSSQEEQKKLLLRQRAQKTLEDITQNMGVHGSIIGKIMRFVYIDHITTAT